ncbi:MAG: hypothetical protein IPK55_13600 [Streptococcus sp.]|nr:hypothetical protein [Streptococcus sp.]
MKDRISRIEKEFNKANEEVTKLRTENKKLQERIMGGKQLSSNISSD